MVYIGKYLLFFGVLVALLVPADEVSAKTGSTQFHCSSLIDDLQAMEKAQSLIMKSLVNNHETMAISLEGYSSEAQVQQQKLNQKAFAKEMKDSAQAFRVRGMKAKKISKDFENASRELLKKVNQCLAKNQ